MRRDPPSDHACGSGSLLLRAKTTKSMNHERHEKHEQVNAILFVPSVFFVVQNEQENDRIQPHLIATSNRKPALDPSLVRCRHPSQRRSG